MPINPELLIAAPMLQDVLIDKTGVVMSGGTITCYHDNSRTTLKNWYYQSGVPNNYTYIALPNPLTLSAAGTICDINGIDTIPFFYPYDETNETIHDPYYITIVNHAQTNQITRENFPFVPSSGTTPINGDIFNNLIVNNGFWRNIQPNTLNASPTSYSYGTGVDIIVAPSQHDGFSSPDIRFIRTNASATDAVTFVPFPAASSQPIKNDIVPEYYLSHNCTVVGSGELQKCYQFPISLHINTLESVPFTLTIQAQNGGGTGAGQNTISLYILQNTGTGTVSPTPRLLGTLTLNSSWQTYTLTSVFPATSGLTLGAGADDALYLQVQMPLSATCTINFTKPCIYLTQNLTPSNEFKTYDQVDAIINSPRTGDVRSSLNMFYPYGWVPMNDGTIGNPSSNATTRKSADTWQLYNLIWTVGKVVDTGVPFNNIAQLYDSSGTPINYGGTAIADFNANKQLALTKMMGRVIMGSVPSTALLATNYTQNVTASNSAGTLLFTGVNSSLMFVGQPVTFTSTGTLPDAIIANAVYFITNINAGGANTFEIATIYSNAIAGTAIAYGSTSGTPTISCYLDTSGVYLGEYAHTQLVSELAAHNHTLTTVTSGRVGTSAVFFNYLNDISGAATSGITGSGTPFNIVQPGVFYNIYIKL